jgi:predicted DNA-binding transcriptional regulator AlpA
MDGVRQRYLRTPEAAEHLGVSKSFMCKARLSGGGPEYIKIGRAVAYSILALEQFAARNRRRSTSECDLAPSAISPIKRRHSRAPERAR